MGKKSPRMPAAPDPTQVAARQREENMAAAKQSAMINQIGQVGPWGSVSYEGEVGSPNRRQVVTLSPEQQAQLNAIRGQVTGRFGEMGSMPAYNTDYSGEGQKLEEATYQAGLNRLQPQIQQQERQMAQTLANRGIPLGSEAYNRAMDQMRRSQGEQMSNLALSAVGAGRQEQQRLADLTMRQRGALLGETGGLLGMQSGLAMPQAYQPANMQIAPTDIAGLIQNQYQSQLAQAQQKAQQRAGGLGSILGLAGTVGGSLMGAPWLGSALGFGGSRAS